MTNHVLNLFAIKNLSELSYKYRLWEVTKLPQKNKNYLENLHRLAGMVASSLCKPVCLYWQGNKVYLATTELTKDIKTEWRLIPHVAVLVPDSNIYELNFSDITPHQIKLALRLLSYNIRSALIKVPEIWNDSYGSFYFREAINAGDDSQVDVLRGFVYRLHYLADKNIYISLDTTVRYVDRISLWARVINGEDVNHYRMHHFLYKFGVQWYRIQFLASTDYCISEQIFYSERDKKTYNVYDYTKKFATASDLEVATQVDPNSIAIVYQYPYKNLERYGASDLCYKTYKTNDQKVAKLHPYSILKPIDRLEKSKELIDKYFQNIDFGNSFKLVIPAEPLEKNIDKFEIPDLIFGNNKILHINRNDENTGINIQDYGKTRLKLLLEKEAGLLTRDALQIQYIFIPKSIHRSIAQKFQEDFEYQMGKFFPHSYKFKKIIYDDQKAKNLRQQVEVIKGEVEKNEIDRGCALLILPENAHSDFHNFIKRELYETLQFQCVDAGNVKKFFLSKNNEYQINENPKQKQRYFSYIRFTALGMLLVNRQWPFALKDSLHYEVYIGIDVLNNYAGFTYIYNGGKDCYFRPYPSAQAEKLTERQILSILKKDLQKDINSLDLHPKSIIIHRDGRSYVEEYQGFIKAINALQQEGFLVKDVQVGVIEIHKTSSSRLRLYYKPTNEPSNTVENPSIGDYFIIDNAEGIVCTTGWPFNFSGTANPLHIKIAYSNLELDITQALSDVFSLSQLGAWAAPDKSARYPATIKLGDTFLEPIASESDDEAALYSEDEPDEEERGAYLTDEDEDE